MTANYVQVPPNSTGVKLQTVENSIAGNSVDASCVAVVTSAGVSCDPPSGTGVAVLGNVNSGAADSGSPVKVGAVYNTSLPALTNGQRGDAQADASGRLIVAPMAGDTTASLTLNGNNTTAVVNCTGCHTVAVQVAANSVFNATITPQVSVDGGTTWASVSFYNVATGAVVTTLGTNTTGTYLLTGTAGAGKAQVVMTPYTSGSATGTIRATTMAPYFQAAQGNVGAGATDSGNGVKVSGVFLANASLPAYTTGQRGDFQIDPAGTQKVGVLPLGTPVYGSSTGANQANNVTLTVPSAKMGYLDGFDVDGTGATAATSVSVTVTGLLGGTLTYVLPVVSGNTTGNVALVRRFNPPLQASAVNTNIVVNVPSFGTGNLAASVNCYGHYV